MELFKKIELYHNTKKLHENLESSIIEDAKEQFCILTDWEYTPDDIEKCVIIDDLDMIFKIKIKTGEKFCYNLKDNFIF